VATPAASETTPATSSKVSYACRHVGKLEIKLDGRPDEPAWQVAEPMKEFRVLRDSAKQAEMPTTARLVWNDDCLFLSFECSNDGIRSAVTERDGPVWEGEAAEMFLCPRGADAFYYEINFTPNNILFDSRIESWKYEAMAKDWKKWAAGFNPAIRSATHVNRQQGGKVVGWSLEAAIPFKDLDVAGNTAPKPGDVWLFNLFRIAMKQDGQAEYSMWQPVHPEFHRPHQFPRLSFERKE
jgi:hypothetical protein